MLNKSVVCYGERCYCTFNMHAVLLSAKEALTAEVLKGQLLIVIDHRAESSCGGMPVRTVPRNSVIQTGNVQSIDMKQLPHT